MHKKVLPLQASRCASITTEPATEVSVMHTRKTPTKSLATTVDNYCKNRYRISGVSDTLQHEAIFPF